MKKSTLILVYQHRRAHQLLFLLLFSSTSSHMSISYISIFICSTNLKKTEIKVSWQKKEGEKNSEVFLWRTQFSHTVLSTDRICVCVYICMYVCVCTHVCLYVCVCLYMYVHVHNTFISAFVHNPNLLFLHTKNTKVQSSSPLCPLPFPTL